MPAPVSSRHRALPTQAWLGTIGSSSPTSAPGRPSLEERGLLLCLDGVFSRLESAPNQVFDRICEFPNGDREVGVDRDGVGHRDDTQLLFGPNVEARTSALLRASMLDNGVAFLGADLEPFGMNIFAAVENR